jgi:hypothetical protein
MTGGWYWCESERPEQEEHQWQMNKQLEESEADDVARAQAEHTQQRQHPERLMRFGNASARCKPAPPSQGGPAGRSPPA